MPTTAQATPATKQQPAGLIVYVPRAAIQTSDKNYRLFGADREAARSLRPSQSFGTDVLVYRQGHTNTACIRTTLEHSAGAAIKAEANLTAEELRELAARLLDAAHDIECSDTGSAAA